MVKWCGEKCNWVIEVITEYFQKHPTYGSMAVGGIFLSLITGAAYQLLFKGKEEHFDPIQIHRLMINPYQLDSNKTFLATFEVSIVRSDCKITVRRMLIDEGGRAYTEEFDPGMVYSGIMERKLVEREIQVTHDLVGEISFMQLFIANCPEKKYTIPSPVQQFRMPE